MASGVTARLSDAPRSSGDARGLGTHAQGGPFTGRALTNSAAGAAKAPKHDINQEPPKWCVFLERPEVQAQVHRRLRARGSGLRPLGELKRQRGRETEERHQAPTNAGCCLRECLSVGGERRDLGRPGLPAGGEGGAPTAPERRARGPPPPGGQSRVNKASTHAAHLPGAATSRPQNSGRPNQVKPDQKSLTEA